MCRHFLRFLARKLPSKNNCFHSKLDSLLVVPIIMSRNTSKWKLKNDFLKFNTGVNHVNPGKLQSLNTTSNQIRQLYNQSYALDFDAWKFGRILIHELKGNLNPQFIQNFFSAIQTVDEVSIVVNDIEHPVIEHDTRIFVQYQWREIWIFAKVFWAMLSRQIKSPFDAYTDSYERLEKLLLSKQISIELEEWTD